MTTELDSAAKTTPSVLAGTVIPPASARTAVPAPRWPRRLATATWLGAVAFGVAFTLLIALTPDAQDAQRRVAALARAHEVAPLAGPLPAKVTAALIAVEDSGFRDHHGVDPAGALRALYGAVAGRTDQGGSTLNQQLAKALYTGGRRGVLDKVEQVALAIKLDVRYSKDEILRMYLDTVYFGHGYYGVRAASRGYFGAEPEALDWPRAALLVGLVQAPDRYDPREHPGRAMARRRHVLARMRATGVLDAPAWRRALAAPIGLAAPSGLAERQPVAG